MTSRSAFNPGNIVRVIDSEENPAEWATFIVVTQKRHQYLLKPIDKLAYEPLWVLPEEICPTTSTL